ncbi:hypothetical protein FUA26_05880 [Seonamhaeicola algicola]|uniref:Lipoprotein n=1 Tax=Seonamhaeicola algicola TaxID=1719036 RepID=A0A5C7AYM0_9FLAO|nr:hypothetical protein [Seonamhaeicola algicola]TXE11595.1 hypothetical protein FUA26_05880 [Seonamhaeicola algicola]
MKITKLTSILLIILLSLLTSCNDENVDSETQAKIDEEIKLQKEEQEKLNIIDKSIGKSMVVQVEIPDSLKIFEELQSDQFVNKGLSDLVDGKFINDKFRYDLLKVIGHSAKLISSNDNKEVYNVEPFNYLKDKPKPEITYPGDNGLLSELKITNKMTATLSFFGIEGGITNEEIYYGSISETANIIIDDKQMDVTKILSQFSTEESREGVELITRVTVTEFLHKKYKKRDKKIKVKEFPIIKSGVSLGTEFFTENSSLERTFKVSINTTSINDIIARLGGS